MAGDAADVEDKQVTRLHRPGDPAHLLDQLVQRHLVEPPIRVVEQAASFAALLVTGAGLFGVLLFLTYYLQINRGFSPVSTGLAFLPMILAMMVVAQMSTNKLLPALGAKKVLPAGFAISSAGLL